MKHRTLKPITPGEILLKEFLEPFHISMAQLAKDIHVPPNRISQIVQAQRDISADTALRLGFYFGTSPEFWLNLQAHHDLELLNSVRDQILSDIVSIQVQAAYGT